MVRHRRTGAQKRTYKIEELRDTRLGQAYMIALHEWGKKTAEIVGLASIAAAARLEDHGFGHVYLVRRKGATTAHVVETRLILRDTNGWGMIRPTPTKVVVREFVLQGITLDDALFQALERICKYEYGLLRSAFVAKFGKEVDRMHRDHSTCWPGEQAREGAFIPRTRPTYVEGALEILPQERARTVAMARL